MNKSRYVFAGTIVLVLSSFTALRLHVKNVPKSDDGSQVFPSPQQPPPPQPRRVWKLYRSARLGFSIDYPSDSFTPLDGAPQGEPDTVSFGNKDWSPQKVAQDIGSSIEVKVDPGSPLNATQDIDPTYPYTVTTLAGLPASEQDEGICPDPACDVRFVLRLKGVLYEININNINVSGADYLSPNEIEHIRQSFTLN